MGVVIAVVESLYMFVPGIVKIEGGRVGKQVIDELIGTSLKGE